MPIVLLDTALLGVGGQAQGREEACKPCSGPDLSLGMLGFGVKSKQLLGQGDWDGCQGLELLSRLNTMISVLLFAHASLSSLLIFLNPHSPTLVRQVFVKADLQQCSCSFVPGEHCVLVCTHCICLYSLSTISLTMIRALGEGRTI